MFYGPIRFMCFTSSSSYLYEQSPPMSELFKVFYLPKFPSLSLSHSLMFECLDIRGVVQQRWYPPRLLPEANFCSFPKSYHHARPTALLQVANVSLEACNKTSRPLSIPRRRCGAFITIHGTIDVDRLLPPHVPAVPNPTTRPLCEKLWLMGNKEPFLCPAIIS